ncbi:hypothetical protein D3C76_328400 [compost metagenome]
MYFVIQSKFTSKFSFFVMLINKLINPVSTDSKQKKHRSTFSVVNGVCFPSVEYSRS